MTDELIAGSGLFMAKAGSVGASGITLILPGQASPTRKAYRRLTGSSSISAGDMILCAKVSGTYVVIDRLA